MFTISLPDNEKERIATALNHMPSPYDAIDDALLCVYPVFAQLPTHLLREILNFGRYPESAGVIAIENLPVDSVLPPTPNDGLRAVAKRTYIAEGCLLGISQLLGEPIGYCTEKRGEIIHNVTPVKSGEYTQSNQGSGVFLNYHNDTVYDESGCFNIFNPDFLMLNCLRADVSQQAETYFADARTILAALETVDVAALREPMYELGAPSTYTREMTGGQIVWSKPLPIITGPDDFPEICLTANGVRPVGATAERVLQKLLATCEAVKETVCLTPGRALLINNRKGVHARSIFKASYGPGDRWLQRTYIRHELWNMRNRCTQEGRVH